MPSAGLTIASSACAIAWGALTTAKVSPAMRSDLRSRRSGARRRTWHASRSMVAVLVIRPCLRPWPGALNLARSSDVPGSVGVEPPAGHPRRGTTQQHIGNEGEQERDDDCL